MAPAGYGSRVEGIHAVGSAVKAGRVETLYVEDHLRNRSDIAALVATVGEDRVSFVNDVRELAATEAPQGVVASCRPIDPVELDDLTGPGAALLVLDHVLDPHNVGASARSALAAGLGGMVVSSRRAAPLSAVAFKAAAGALESLPVAVVGSIPQALSRLRELGTWIVGLEASAADSLFGLGLLTEPVAVVVGSEGTGLAPLTARRCDVLASVPMSGGVGSLNASITAALASFEIMRIRAGLAQR